MANATRRPVSPPGRIEDHIGRKNDSLDQNDQRDPHLEARFGGLVAEEGMTESHGIIFRLSSIAEQKEGRQMRAIRRKPA